MRQVLGPGALGRPRGMGWRGKWERGSGWGIHVNPWLIHVNVWQKPLQYCKIISLQLIKINEKNKCGADPHLSISRCIMYLQMYVCIYVHVNMYLDITSPVPLSISQMGFPGGPVGKESACNAGYLGSIPTDKIPWRRACNPLQYPAWRILMDRGAW